MAVGSDLAGARVLVTGGTGMIGASLVRRLVADGGRPVVVARRSSDRARLAGIAERIDFAEGDLADPGSIAAVVGKMRPDVLFHFASTFFNPPTLSNGTHFSVNVLGTQALLDSLRDRPEVRFVFAGSASVYAGGNALAETAPLEPASMFGATKAAGSVAGQAYARVYGIGFVELRLFTPFGPWERPGRLIPHTILRALAGEDVDIGDGRQERDFVFIDDVIEAALSAATAPLSPGTVLNIGSGEGRPIASVAGRVLSLMDDPVSLRIGARESRKDEIWRTSADISAARRLLNWSPRVAFDEGLRRTIGWFRTNRALAGSLP